MLLPWKFCEVNVDSELMWNLIAGYCNGPWCQCSSSSTTFVSNTISGELEGPFPKASLKLFCSATKWIENKHTIDVKCIWQYIYTHHTAAAMCFLGWVRKRDSRLSIKQFYENSASFMWPLLLKDPSALL